MKPLAGALLLAAIVSSAARAEENWSVHGGAGLSLLIVATAQLQLESQHWLIAAEAAAGLGPWRLISEFAVVKAGRIFEGDLHPYVVVGAGISSAYDGDNLTGSGVAVVAEAGLLLGKERHLGRIMPFIELPIALWSVPDPKSPGNPWHPGVGIPMIGVRFLL